MSRPSLLLSDVAAQERDVALEHAATIQGMSNVEAMVAAQAVLHTLLNIALEGSVTRVNSTNVLDKGLRSGEEQRLEIPGSRLAHDVPRFTSPRWRIATSC
jgi:hypothetical protein